MRFLRGVLDERPLLSDPLHALERRDEFFEIECDRHFLFAHVPGNGGFKCELLMFILVFEPYLLNGGCGGAGTLVVEHCTGDCFVDNWTVGAGQGFTGPGLTHGIGQ